MYLASFDSRTARSINLYDSSGTVYVAVLANPYETVHKTVNSIMPLFIALISIAIPLILIKYTLRMIKLFHSFIWKLGLIFGLIFYIVY
ncbi:MAG: hypothetical protein QXT15_07325, partial [Desulfurococcaceae archaeon]